MPILNKMKNNKTGKVISVNVSKNKGTIKEPVNFIEIINKGIKNDAHADTTNRQISLLSLELIDAFSKEMQRKIRPGEFAENITSAGVDLAKVFLLDRFKIGEVELEVTQIGKECHGSTCAIFKEIGKCIMPKNGIFCRVLKTGLIKPDYEIIHLKKVLKIMIITLSDRVSKGEYKDESGPAIKEIVNNFLNDKFWDYEIYSVVLPDDRKLLEEKLKELCNSKIDIIITTGGTGLGQRDITPEVVIPLCNKIISGIMENIRIKYGKDNPRALLSRGIAGIIDRTLIYTLPGSTRAVKEYMKEILKTFEHLILMINGLGH